MKYIVIPENVVLSRIIDGKAEKMELTFADYLGQNVFNQEVWRSNADYFMIGKSLRTKFKNIKPGDVVEVSDREHEKFEPLVCLRGKEINGEFKDQLMDLMEPVIMAPSKDPRED